MNLDKSDIISTDEDPSLRIESFANCNNKEKRGVSTNYNHCNYSHYNHYIQTRIFYKLE